MGGLSQREVAWAMQHDWFRRTCRCQDNEAYEFVIGVVVYDSCDDELKVFTGYTELRAWAGY